jgi:hypothetical protein
MRATPLESSSEVEACEGAASKTEAEFEGIGSSRYDKGNQLDQRPRCLLSTSFLEINSDQIMSAIVESRRQICYRDA